MSSRVIESVYAGANIGGISIVGYVGPITGVETVGLQTTEHSGLFNTPIETLPESPVTMGSAYLTDYYGRIWIVPTSVNFGALAGDVATREVILWNAYIFTSSELELVEIFSGNGEGVVLEAQDGGAVIRTLGPLETLEIDVTATADGPAEIDVVYHFNFGPGIEGPYLPVTGIRAALWDYGVNWRESVKTTIEYKTTIFAARADAEQRSALRLIPRVTLEFLSTAMEGKGSIADRTRLFQKFQNRVVIVPDWTRRSKVTEVTSDGLTATVRAAQSWMVPDQLCVIGVNGAYALRTIESVVGNQVSFVAGDAEDWSGATLYLGLSGLFEESMRMTPITNRHAEFRIAFQAAPGLGFLPTPAEPTIMLGEREVFLLRPDWNSSLSVSMVAPRETVDFGFGRTATFRPIAFVHQVSQGTYRGLSADEIQLYRDLFDRMAGMQGEFYMPSWVDDLVLKTKAGINSFELTVEGGTEVYDFYSDSTTARAVALFLYTGEIVLRELTAITVIDGDTVLSVKDDGMPYDIYPEDVKRFSWLYVCRFASDRLSLEYLTDSKAQATLSIKSLENIEGDEV